MSEASKIARRALKSKAHRLAEPHKGAVDASGWTEPTDEGAGVQTGMRPISKRQYKRGGKVKVKLKHHLGHAEGEKAQVRADRKPRKAGGKAEMPPVDRFINADKKKANEYRDGPKHVGGMKAGGRTKKMDGGSSGDAYMRHALGHHDIPGGGKMTKGMGLSDSRNIALGRGMAEGNPSAQYAKSGGRTKKMDGGPMMGAGGVDPRVAALLRAKMMAGRGAPAAAPAVDPRIAALIRAKMAAAQGAPAGVDPRVAALLKARAAGAGAPPMKKGGRTKKFGGGAMGGGMGAPMNASQSAGMGNQMFGQGMAAAQGGMGQQGYAQQAHPMAQQGYAQQAQPMAQQAQPMAQHAQFGPQGMLSDANRQKLQTQMDAYRAARSQPQHPNVPPPQQAQQQAPVAYSPPAMQAAPAQQQQAQGGYANAPGGMGNQMYGQGAATAAGMLGVGNQNYNQAMNAAQGQGGQGQGYANAAQTAAGQLAAGNQNYNQAMNAAQGQGGQNQGYANAAQGNMGGQGQGGLGNQMFGQGAMAAQQQAALGQGLTGMGQGGMGAYGLGAATNAMNAAQNYNQAGMGGQGQGQGAATAAGMLGVGNQNYNQAMNAAQNYNQAGMGGQGQGGLGQQAFNQQQSAAQQQPQQQSTPYTQASWAGNNLASMAGGLTGGNPGGFKRGGRTMHDDEAADRALVKRMVKPEARTGKAKGGETEIHHSSCRCHRCMGGRMGKKHGGALSVSDGREEGTRPTGGRMARGSGTGRQRRRRSSSCSSRAPTLPRPGLA